MLVHVMENANIPTVWRDLDMDQGDSNDHKRRQTRVILEMLVNLIGESFETYSHMFISIECVEKT